MNSFLLTAAPIDMPAPLGFADWLTFWLVVVVSAVNGVMLILAGYKFLQVLQLSNYKISGYFAWIKHDKGAYWGRLLILSFLSSACLLITNVLLGDFFIYKIMEWLGLLFYLLFTTIFVINRFQAPVKTPLRYTHRMNRLIVVTFILIFFSTLFLLNFTTIYIPYFKYGAVGLTPVLLPIFIMLAFYITWPYEKIKTNIYIKKARKKLDEMPDLIKIGITGSFGKTSVKNILATILAEKFSVCASPYSYNTTLGITKTINENLKPTNQVLICEMGARFKGDIKEICDLVKPNIGILTGIGNQHLATFKTQENLIATKLELFDAVKSKGTMFVNVDANLTKQVADKLTGKVVKASLTNPSGALTVKDILVTTEGCQFVLATRNEEQKVKTGLLGEHNISNILLCTEVALSLGLTIKEIANGIKKLTPVAHRLALFPSANSLIIIDDAYNGSVEGANVALNVLSKFEGQKFVITPGLVELGKEQFNSNFNFGKSLAGVADYVIISGISNYEAIKSGLLYSKFDESKILRAGSNKQAVELMNNLAKAGDVVLFENDLPDNYA